MVQRARDTVNASNLTIPAAIVLGLLAQAAVYGFREGGESRTTATNTEAVDKLTAAVTALQNDKALVRLEVRFENLEKQIVKLETSLDSRFQTERRLNQDYLEGRVGHMPYRPPRRGRDDQYDERDDP